ncbi:MAG: adenylate/guanylate cyclase domain-containing protein [Turneriella sp.]
MEEHKRSAVKNLLLFKIFTNGKARLQFAVTSILVVLLAVSSIVTLAYTYIHVSDAALRSARQMMKQANSATSRDILRFMGMARRTVRAAAWSFRDIKAVHSNRERLFPLMAGLLRAQREIFAISVGDSHGSLLMVGKIFDDPKYSVDKKKPLPKEVVYRSHFVDRQSTPMTEYYIYMDKDMKVIDREIVSAGKIKYDARTKQWYKDADEHKENTWTDMRIYSNGEFGTANVQAITNDAGDTRLVVSTSIALSLKEGISSRLHIGQNGIGFLVDGDGQLIAYPERNKITKCAPPGEDGRAKCDFQKVTEVGNPALAAAFAKYKERTNLDDEKNIPKRLNFQDYMRAIKRLDEDGREAFDKAYAINEAEKTILLKKPVTKEVKELIPDILDSIGYTYNVRFSANDQEYLASFREFPESYGKEWMIGVLVPVNDFIGGLRKTIFEVILMSAGILLLSIGLIIFLAHRILKPLKLIAQDMNRIQHLDIDEAVTHKSFFYEISLISDALASMKHGLKAFSKFVPFTLVKQLIASGKGAELGGEKRRLTMMFTDIANFTTISESMTTESLLQHISEYLDNLTTIILAEQGTVDKYIGDAIMCFWGAPNPVEEQEAHSCLTALRCLAKLRELNARWATEGKPALNTRFGISSGDVSVGNMGSSDRMNYTVLGDAVNLASRLEAINKYYGTDIIIGENTYAAVKDRFCFRPIDVVAVKGKTRGVRIYQLLAGSENDGDLAPSAAILSLKSLTERAFTAYLKKDFKTALKHYTELRKKDPDSPLGEMFIERCRDYIKKPPAANWDGVTHMKTK